MTDKILVIGAGGQIGLELIHALAADYGYENVVPADIRDVPGFKNFTSATFNALDAKALFETVTSHGITQIYHLAALLSATGEQQPELAWKLNMESLFHVLNLAKEGHIKKVYWPSSIAVFGPTTPRHLTPQYTVMEPSTIYGISKQAGERWCAWYHNKFNVDVRSLRYPGLIGWKTPPGGGTTDYAVHIFHEALKHKQYTCFLKSDTALPMMHMDDAIRATRMIMEAPASSVKIRGSYNVSAMSFTPAELANIITTLIPEFEISYAPDFRQAIADSWPASIDDTEARSHWGWKPSFDVKGLCQDMLKHLKPNY
ncbi:MAG: NAD-dependent epimerase/dehydratase family protein [Bacteroidota bacterium]|nr:NAD-dependent epimerase/dehydratase family protein [Sphingobacteriia bacterium]